MEIIKKLLEQQKFLLNQKNIDIVAINTVNKKIFEIRQNEKRQQEKAREETRDKNFADFLNFSK